ncbi:MAG: dihydroorotase, partial [Bacteroidetes bacterium]|nr:dihydroorotase [Bacteroidota bacterium]
MLFINGTINSGSGFRRADLRIKDGKIQQIGILQPDDSEEVIDIAGKILLPGFVDVHVHFREPGFGYKETIESGSKAAAAGGYTAVCTMPNLAPPPDSVANINIQKEIIAKSAVVKVYPLATITVGQKGGGSLVDFDSMKHEVAFSDDGRGVQSREMMAEAMKEVAKFDGMIVAHCEVDELVKGGYIHDGEYCSRHGHKGICSRSEWEQVARDVELAKATGCRYHVCHVSTKESVDIIRKAKAEGVRVTCETAPHYLILLDLDLEEDGRFKMNPPIRSVEDREALRAGLIDGTIDVIATDHAPHSAEEKSRGLARSAFGIVGLETAFSLIYTHLVEKGIISWELLIK